MDKTSLLNSKALLKRMERVFPELIKALRPNEPEFISKFTASILGFSSPSATQTKRCGNSQCFVISSAEGPEYAVLSDLEDYSTRALQKWELPDVRFVAAAKSDGWEIWRRKQGAASEYQLLHMVAMSTESELAKLALGLFHLSVEYHERAQCFGESNRYRWYNYHNLESDAIELRFLVKFWLYEDRSEKVQIPHLNLTLWGDRIFEGRQQADAALDQYIRESLQRSFPDSKRSVGVASRLETETYADLIRGNR